MYDVIVIGGGASGMMSAISAAQRGLSVAILEKKKILDKSSTSQVVGDVISQMLLMTTENCCRYMVTQSLFCIHLFLSFQ